MTWEVPPKGIKLLAPAKVNLTLEILRKRPDGYHELRSLMQPISLFDTLWIEPGSDKPKLICPEHPELENENNLILKTLVLLEKELGEPLNITIRLKKRIPMGGGLGGGSSDAAALLDGLNDLFGRPVSRFRLAEMASRLGSDVPFFLIKGPALATGRGEILQPQPHIPSWWIILVYPGFPVSTAWAYGQVKFPLTQKKKPYNILGLTYRGNPVEGLEDLYNDLEPFVVSSFPLLGTIKKTLLDFGCQQALMSGSGSSVFGIWEDKLQAGKAFRQLKKQNLGQVFLVKGL
ncbi:MAG TPA: 4-(cytidine 5'-diphospho)-2-C-methyl-D-erythritol kinase [Thermodesulfobacteriota bacterium]|nr:4-(cytidine 5'-diphospho)-2-C-methyl-D-erythritol kinase [Thermodesulfobacteriota bacterium]